MAKARSPGYPAVGLREAVDRVRLVWEQDYQNEIPKVVVAQHMGYRGLSGTALTMIASLTKYGLLEGRGDNTRVSDRALTILAHQPGDKERIAALIEAAESPSLFAELDERYPGGKTSDSALRSFLLTKKFIPDAADAIIRSYRLTKQLVEEESKGYASSDHEIEEDDMHHTLPRERQLQPPSVPIRRGEGEEPFRVSFGGRGMEITGRIQTEKDADDLIQAVQALKILLRPMDEIKRPEGYNPEDDDGDSA